MPPDTPLERQQRAGYLRDFVPAVVGYLVLLPITLTFVGDEVTTVGEWMLVLLPVLPALWGVRAVVRLLRRLDEYQRSIQLESMATGFAVSMVAAITLGFVGVGGTSTVAGGWYVYGAGMLAWGLSVRIRTRS